ncbi:hypothetical protein BT93_L0049 [Corymbia citriodora subsp. variegata]|uniref:Uncharacterized protein n=1 Tax=Corymbia citriodora subsp. variegata TaxID=360336 RepID=A0A8T0CIH1_CORYI|nr:hypothetical protein BT93_L0049 [Corymbia citriodora subsp. variegata]
MDAIRQKLRRNLSMHDKNANLDEHDDLDEESTGHLHKDIEDAETNEKYPQGRPGSFLNRLISHGNKKTEDEIAAAQAAADKSGQTTMVGSATTTSGRTT